MNFVVDLFIGWLDGKPLANAPTAYQSAGLITAHSFEILQWWH